MWYHKGNGLSTEASDDFVPQTYSKFVYTNFELDRRKAGTKRFFYKGDISFLNDLRAVAVIGSREASKEAMFNAYMSGHHYCFNLQSRRLNNNKLSYVSSV